MDGMGWIGIGSLGGVRYRALYSAHDVDGIDNSDAAVDGDN